MSGSRLEIGLVLPTLEKPQSGEKSQWPTIRTVAQQAEAMGFDTVWIADELLWRVPDWPGARGWWECVSMTGAVAARLQQSASGPGCYPRSIAIRGSP